MDLRTEKCRIRQEMIDRRRRLRESGGQVEEKGRRIRSRILALKEYRNAGLVHCYVSMPDEIDTLDLIEQALGSGKRVAVPVVQKGSADLRHSEILTLSALQPVGPWGLCQPPSDRLAPVEPREIDLVLVPGLAFDRAGGRIGFGAGYYDRFLTGLTAPKIALAYEFQLAERVPTMDEDVPMDLIVTEEGTYRCSDARG